MSDQDRQGHHERQPWRRTRYGYRAHRSGALQWAVALVFTALAVVVLVAAVAVLLLLLLLQPRSPYIAVRSELSYDQQGTLDDVQLSLVVEARNGNAHAAAGFSDLEVRLAFGGAVVTKLRAASFGVPAKRALPLAYVARARGMPLEATRSAAGVVPFGVDGEARTRWKVAGVVAVSHWTRLACEIRFFWPNGTAQDFSCSSKSKFWFF